MAQTNDSSIGLDSGYILTFKSKGFLDRSDGDIWEEKR